MRQRIHQILKEHWGYDQFRPLQEDIILSVLDNRDTLALLPTGGGKSICFQVPALAREGVCLVVSPLIALMKDQVANLRKKGVKAAAIYSGMSRAEIGVILDNCLFDKELKFLYLSPERLTTEVFLAHLKRMKVGMIAVDEAHCISQWGYDFRPPYLEIANIRQYCPGAPVLALTATATPEVVDDIQEKLRFKEKNVFQKSFKRDNLTYYVQKEQDKLGRMLRIMQHYPGTGIVYVRNRRKTRETAEFLQRHGISADYYHAGLDPAVRDRKQQAWMDGTTRVIVSTNAFGMGIDKPDVRFVVHIDIPDTLEGYFQEAGRGGRDLQPSVAILLYDDADLRDLKRNFQTAFPPLPFIQQVYRTLCSDLHIPIAGGLDESYPVDLADFARRHEWNPVEVYQSIRLMEKTGAITYDDDKCEPAQLMFLLSQEDIDNLKKTPLYQKAEPFIQLLLRSYSGIFAHPVIIDEAEIARRADCTEKVVKERLNYLAKFGYVEYHPRNSLPKVLFTRPRVDEKYLFYDRSVYDSRKQVAKKRLDSVTHYVTDNTVCRSRQLLAYFGETESDACGKCDVCRAVRAARLRRDEFNQIRQAVIEAYPQCADIKELVNLLGNRFDEDRIVEVARWLIDNNKLS